MITLAVAALACMGAGCNRSATRVAGLVTYEGRPVQKGAVSFVPVDGQGPSCGGAIANGRYTAQLSPGRKIVRIVEMKTPDHILTREEIEQAAAKQKETGEAAAADELLPPDADGNNVEIEIQPGSQTIDFALKRPTNRAAMARP